MSDLNPTVVHAWLDAFARLVSQHAPELTELDRRIGDADHGSNLDRGMRAVVEVDPTSFPDAASYLKKAAMTLVSTVGGAAGPLYGTFLLRVASSLPGDGPITARQWADALAAGVAGVEQRGRAQVGDKTMVDALAPAADAFRSTGDDVAAAWRAAADAAAAGRDATEPLVARKGRASYLGARSAGHQDPGAASAALLIQAAADTLA